MNGVTILNTIVNKNIYFIFNAACFAFALMCTLSLLMLISGARGNTYASKHIGYYVACTLISGFLLIGSILLHPSNEGIDLSRYTYYECMVDDSVSINEFLSRYEIIGTGENGTIFVKDR